MMIIFLYLARNFLKTFFMVLLFVLALILIVDGIDQYGNVRSYGATLAECVIYVLIRVPTNLYQFLPLVILISALSFFLNLSKHSELVALRASGISANRIVFVPVLMSFCIGLFSTFPFDPLLVGSRNIAETYLDSFRGRPSQIVRTLKDGVWLREVVSKDIRYIYIPEVKWNNQSFQNIEFFIKKPGQSITHITSKIAKIENEQWNLSDAIVYPEPTQTDTNETNIIQLDTSLNFRNIFSSFSDPKRIQLKNLPEFISNLERDGYDIKEAKTYYYSERMIPVFYMLMALIGSIFALAPLRGGSTSLRAVSAISTGFVCFGVTKLCESLAKAGDVPIILGVSLIPIAGILLGTSLLLHQEDG